MAGISPPPRARTKRFSKRLLRKFHEEHAKAQGKEKVSFQELRDALREGPDKITVAPATLGNWFRDNNPAKPDVDSLRALVNLYGKSWEDFFE
jgi:hypothetical protein